MGRYEELNDALTSAKNEHDIGEYLKQNLDLIKVLNEHSWNCVVPKAEFQIGTDYRADFIILSACSGYWNCVLIEMQGPHDKIYNKRNEQSRGLREAQRQVEDWKRYIGTNGPAFRNQLAKLAADMPAFCSRVDIHTLASTELRDPNTVVEYTYKILIGRRAYLDEANNGRRATHSDYEIVTFDRLLDYAKRLDEADLQRENDAKANAPRS